MLSGSIGEGRDPKKISLTSLGFYLLIVFSGFYLIDLKVSPIYPISGLGYLILIIPILQERRIRIPGPTGIPIFILLIWQIISLIVLPSLNVWIAVSMSLIAYVFISAYRDYFSIVQVQKLIRSFLWVNGILLLLETIIRFAFPDISHLSGMSSSEIEELRFYIYKVNSFMYLDSNFTAIHVLACLSLSIFSQKFFRGFNNRFTIFFFLLLLLTISRATILAGTLMLLFLWVPRNLRFFSAIAGIIGAILALLYLKNDPSFQTKFEIFKLTWEYLKDASIIQLIFGSGWGNAIDQIGMGAHNLITTYLVEGGLVFFILILWFWIKIIRATLNWALLFLVPYWIAGLSFAFTAPFIFVALGLMMVSVYQREHHGEVFTQVMN